MIARWDFFISCPASFHTQASLLTFFVCFFILFQTGEGGWFVIFRIFKSILFFCQLNFIVLFPFLIKYYHILFIIIVFWLGCDRPSRLLLFVPALLLSILTPLFLPSSSVSLSYFVLAVPMRECLGKHSCIGSHLVLSYWMVLFFRETWSKWSKCLLSKTTIMIIISYSL